MSEQEKNVASWDFNVFLWDKDALVKLAARMLSSSCSLPKEKLLLFVESVKDNYLDNPYHNFYHAVEVLQFIYKIDQENILSLYFSPKERFSLMIAALGHDIAHPGQNGSYQELKKSHLFERFGADSTLEKYHAEVLFKLLISASLIEEIDEKLVERLILSTDIAKHGHLLDLIAKQRLSQKEALAILLMKCADLGQLIRPSEISKKWVLLLQKEQYLQHHLEKEEGMQGLSDDEFQEQQYEKQTTFLESYGKPLYEELIRHIPQLDYFKTKI